MEDLAAPVPPELRAVDDVLDRYGAWATGRRRPKRCGSAEGRYRSDDQPRRASIPDRPSLTRSEIMDAQRALAAVPARYREALLLLYLPRRTPLPVLLRKARLTPAEFCHRQTAGLQHFAAAYAYMRSVSERSTSRPA